MQVNYKYLDYLFPKVKIILVQEKNLLVASHPFYIMFFPLPFLGKLYHLLSISNFRNILELKTLDSIT